MCLYDETMEDRHHCMYYTRIYPIQCTARRTRAATKLATRFLLTSCVCPTVNPNQNDTPNQHRRPPFFSAEEGPPEALPQQQKPKKAKTRATSSSAATHPPTLYLTQSPTSQYMGIIFPLGTILPGPTFTTSPTVGRLERVADSAMSTPAEDVVVPLGTAFTLRSTLSPIMRDVSRLIWRRESHPEREEEGDAMRCHVRTV